MSSKRLPPQPQPSQGVDLSLATDVQCDNCGNYTFTEVQLMKHLSAVASPTGKAGYVPVPTFACNACGFVNDNFLPPFMRKDKKTETVEATTAEPSAPTEPTPSPTKIEIVR